MHARTHTCVHVHRRTQTHTHVHTRILWSRQALATGTHVEQVCEQTLIPALSCSVRKRHHSNAFVLILSNSSGPVRVAGTVTTEYHPVLEAYLNKLLWFCLCIIRKVWAMPAVSYRGSARLDRWRENFKVLGCGKYFAIKLCVICLLKTAIGPAKLSYKKKEEN